MRSRVPAQPGWGGMHWGVLSCFLLLVGDEGSLGALHSVRWMRVSRLSTRNVLKAVRVLNSTLFQKSLSGHLSLFWPQGQRAGAAGGHPGAKAHHLHLGCVLEVLGYWSAGGCWNAVVGTSFLAATVAIPPVSAHSLRNIPGLIQSHSIHRACSPHAASTTALPAPPLPCPTQCPAYGTASTTG